jgi:hypothetical protein
MTRVRFPLAAPYIIIMLKTWLLIAWVGTTSNFTILHESFTKESCEEEKKVWMTILNNQMKFDCVQDLKEGRSLYPTRPGFKVW